MTKYEHTAVVCFEASSEALQDKVRHSSPETRDEYSGLMQVVDYLYHIISEVMKIFGDYSDAIPHLVGIRVELDEFADALAEEGISRELFLHDPRYKLGYPDEDYDDMYTPADDVYAARYTANCYKGSPIVKNVRVLVTKALDDIIESLGTNDGDIGDKIKALRPMTLKKYQKWCDEEY